MQRRAAEYDSRIVPVSQLLLFSTETEDAWLLDLTDQLAGPLARDGEAASLEMAEGDISFSVLLPTIFSQTKFE